MKITRYIVIVAGIVAVFAATAWFLRNDLIQRFSNPLLADYGLTIADVSFDALATKDVSISYLELVHEKGTSVIIEDLTLPISTGKAKSKTYRARKVSVVTATRTDGESFEMADLIRQFLSLPVTLADNIIIVDEFNLAPYPALSEIRWEIRANEQRLEGTVESVGMSMRTARRGSGDYDVSFLLQHPPAAIGGHILSATLRDEAAGLTLTGNNSVHLQTWQPLARLTGMIPQELEIASGMADLSFDVAIPNDATQAPTVAASLAPTSPVRLNYGGSDADAVAILVQSAGSTEVLATFPRINWSLALAEASLLVRYGDWNDIPLSISDVACEAVITCSLKTRVALSDAMLPVGSVAEAEFSSAQQVHFLDTGIRIDVQPGATFRLDSLRTQAGELERVQSELVSPARLVFRDTGWQLTADSIDAQIQDLTLVDDVSASLPLYLENVIVDADGERLSLSSGVFAPSSRASWDGRTIALPGFKGTASLHEDYAAADLQTVGLQEEAAIKVQHDLATTTGKATVDHGAASFAKTSLAHRVSPWPDDQDLVAGTVSFEVSANWVEGNSRLAFNAQATVAATNLAGFYGDTAFTGVATLLAGSYRSGSGFKVGPSTVTASFVEIGVPVKSLSADYLLDLNALSVDVASLRMSAFGGIVTADPFSFRTDRAVNTLTLNTASLDLTELLSLKGFEAVEVTGSVNARLPLTLEGDTVTIENGALTGNRPGGVIRYRPTNPRAKSDVSSFAFVERVLSNFEYKTMASDVNLSKEGDLILNLKLTGRNPDLDEKRPVVLNVGVENNIPQMLRSLRTTRAVEDVLERQLGK